MDLGSEQVKGWNAAQWQPAFDKAGWAPRCGAFFFCVQKLRAGPNIAGEVL